MVDLLLNLSKHGHIPKKLSVDPRILSLYTNASLVLIAHAEQSHLISESAFCDMQDDGPCYNWKKFIFHMF